MTHNLLSGIFHKAMKIICTFGKVPWLSESAHTKLVRAGVVPCRSPPLGGERARAERALLVDLTQEPHEAQGEETARGRATREGSHTIVVAAGERYGERREESRRDRDSLRRLRHLYGRVALGARYDRRARR